MEARSKKILFGCLGGCGFVVLVFVGSCVAFTVWINSPGEVLEPQDLLGPETTGYAEWTLRLEDPGTAEFVDAMLEGFGQFNQGRDSPLPDGLEQFINARQMRGARKDLEKFFPLVVAWTSRPADDIDRDEYLFSVSARGLGHQMILLDWALGWFIGRSRDVETVRHAGDTIYVLREDDGARPVAFIRKGIVFVATDLESAQRTLDRLDRPAERSAAATTELDALFRQLPEEQSLRGAVTNRDGEVLRILDHLGLAPEHADHEFWSELRGATISAVFQDQEVFAGTVYLHGPNTAWAEDHATILGAGVESLFEKTKIDFDTEVRADAGRVRVDFSATDLLDQVKQTTESRLP